MFGTRRESSRRSGARRKNAHRLFERGCVSVRSQLRAALIGIAVMPFVMPGTASAETEVQGQAANLQLRAQNASVREVLDALSRTIKLKYKLPANFARQLSGHFSGNLHQVLVKILDGSDYFVRVSDDGVEVVVLGPSGATVAIPAQVIQTSPAIPAIAPSNNKNTAKPQAPPIRALPNK